LNDQYAVDFRRSLFRVDPMMPILGVIAGAAATIFAKQRSGAAGGLAWVGLGFIVLVVVASITIAEPINSKFRRLPEGQVPQRAGRRFHAVRNLAALAALACFCGRSRSPALKLSMSTVGPLGDMRARLHKVHCWG
jgi:hypothetical protein